MANRRVFWEQRIVKQLDVARYLTAYNFQPGKFHIIPVDSLNVLIVYADREVPNVE